MGQELHRPDGSTLGWAAADQGDQVGLARGIELRGCAGARLIMERRLRPFFAEALAGASHRGCMLVQGRPGSSADAWLTSSGRGQYAPAFLTPLPWRSTSGDTAWIRAVDDHEMLRAGLVHVARSPLGPLPTRGRQEPRGVGAVPRSLD